MPFGEPGQEIVAGPGTVTAINGLTFVVSDELGDIHSGLTGLMVNDTRHLSSLKLTIDGLPLQRLGAAVIGSSRVHFHSFAPAIDTPDPALECARSRVVDQGGFTEHIGLRWWGAAGARAVVQLELDCDFADIFTVRRPSPDPPPAARAHWDGDRLVLSNTESPLRTAISFSIAPDRHDDHEVRWNADLDRDVSWELGVTVVAQPSVREHVRLGWRSTTSEPATASSSPDDLQRACAHSLADFDRLTTPDVLSPGRRLLTAGIPWFVALFGRDSLIASYQARAFAPDRLIDTLFALAARQGRARDSVNDEEPGKILHEVRLTERPWLGSGTERGARPYFGSVDATPLFLVMLGVACRWGASRADVASLLPAADAALEWMRRDGDRDGDGLIEYAAGGARSLVNQGWKDSENAIQFADGTLAEGPIALLEVQGYAYRARRELAEVLAWLGDAGRAAELAAEADEIRQLIREKFWIPGRGAAPGFFALALDGHKQQVDAIASNMGHLLWCGVPSNEEAEQVAAWLVHPDLANGWGVRTLSRAMAGYNPISYHLGSVWPHDTALACEGLRRYSLDAEAMQLVDGLLSALDAFGGRLPELFGGHARDELPLPVPYPSACRPQAWSAGVPLSLVPLLLGLEPACHRGTVALNPVLPARLERLRVTGVTFGRPGEALTVEIGADGTRVVETPATLSVELHAGYRGGAHGDR